MTSLLLSRYLSPHVYST